MPLIYKILPATLWNAALSSNRFEGAAIDLVDGFIHFSAASQVEETARLHFGGQAGLVLVAVESERLSTALKWEPSRDGALFPHLYGTLAPALVHWVKPLPWDGLAHVFPEGWRL